MQILLVANRGSSPQISTGREYEENGKDENEEVNEDEDVLVVLGGAIVESMESLRCHQLRIVS